jgi:release factor glutamine methyltransferase
MTVLEAIQKSREFLESKGVESARLESEWLLSHVLNMPRLQLYLSFERILTSAETDLIRALVKRRGAREPLQHILGTACFCGLEIAVNRDVLVPRPETEILAEQGWSFLRKLGRPSSFLDFGAGSGCIAIALCHFALEARGLAIDKSPAALQTAQANAERNHVSDRLQFLEGDGFSAVPPDSRFDLIISNPPYIPAGEIASLQPEVREFDPHSALDGGPDGLDFYQLLARKAPRYLASGGLFMAEIGDSQQKDIDSIFTAAGWSIDRFIHDHQNRSRIVQARRL